MNLDPPPSVVQLVKDDEDANRIWTNWLSEFRDWAKENMSKDFYTEVQLGNVDGHSLVHKFGRNDAVPNGSFEIVELESTLTTSYFPQAATTIRIAAGGNAADTAAGAGAQQLTVEGLDDTGALASENIVTAGASASSATTTSFWRIFRAYIPDGACGTYGAANTGAITIENSAGTQNLMLIGAGEGQSQHGTYTVPLGKTAYVLSAFLTVDFNKTADFRFCKRHNMTDVTTPFSPTRIMNYWDGVSGVLPFKPVSPGGALPALTDVWMESQGSGAVAEVSADFELLLVDN